MTGGLDRQEKRLVWGEIKSISSDQNERLCPAKIDSRRESQARPCAKPISTRPAQFVQSYDLTDDERDALLKLDIGRLYAKGVHGLLLRPFTIIHSVSEPDYLKAIRGEN